MLLFMLIGERLLFIEYVIQLKWGGWQCLAQSSTILLMNEHCASSGDKSSIKRFAVFFFFWNGNICVHSKDHVIDPKICINLTSSAYLFFSPPSIHPPTPPTSWSFKTSVFYKSYWLVCLFCFSSGNTVSALHNAGICLVLIIWWWYWNMGAMASVE